MAVSQAQKSSQFRNWKAGKMRIAWQRLSVWITALRCRPGESARTRKQTN